MQNTDPQPEWAQTMQRELAETVVSSRDMILAQMPTARSADARPNVRGPKNTTLMRAQRKSVAAYLLVEAHRTNEEVRPEDCLRVWNDPANKTYWDNHGRRTDKTRGYEDYMALYRAFIYWEIDKKKRRR